MKWKVLADAPHRIFVLVLETGDELMASLERFAADRSLSASHFTGIGAASSAKLAYFDWDAKTYREIPVDDQVEIVSLMGNLTTRDGALRPHAHAALGRFDGSIVGGHLMSARIRPACEIFITETSGRVVRGHDPESGLPLIEISYE